MFGHFPVPASGTFRFISSYVTISGQRPLDKKHSRREGPVREFVGDIGSDRAFPAWVERRPRARLDLHARGHIRDFAAWEEGGILDEERLSVDMALIRNDLTVGCQIVDMTCQSGPQAPTNVSEARRPEILEQRGPLLVRQAARHGRVTLSFETETVAEHHEIDVLGKAFNESEGLGQGHPALKEQPRMPLGPLVEQGVENKANPKVLFHVARQRVEAGCRRFENIPPVLLWQSEEWFKASGHTAAT